MMKPSTTQPTRSETPSAQELVHRGGQPMFLAKPESFTTVTGLDTNLAEVYDQDTGNLRVQQEGFHAAARDAAELSGGSRAPATSNPGTLSQPDSPKR